MWILVSSARELSLLFLEESWVDLFPFLEGSCMDLILFPEGSYVDLFLFLEGSCVDLFLFCGSNVNLFLQEPHGPDPVPGGATWTCSCGSHVDLFLFLKESCVDLFLFLELRGPAVRCEQLKQLNKRALRSSSILAFAPDKPSST